MDTKFLQQIKHDLVPLAKLPEEELAEISELAWELLSNGFNKNIYKSISQKLILEQSSLENAVSAVALLLVESSKHKTSQEDFTHQAQFLEVSPTFLVTIYQCYKEHEKELAEALRGSEIDSAQYKNIHWRLESQLASRSLQGGLNPRVIVKLELERRGCPENVALVSDIPNIIHWSQMVENALAEARTHNSRRIQRAVT